MAGLDPELAEVQDALAKVLARPEFQVSEPGRLAALYAQIRQRAWEAFATILEQLFGAGGSALSVLLRFSIALVAVLLAVHITLALVRAWRARRGEAPPSSPVVDAGPGGDIDWTSAANRAAREGRFRDAILALYQALLNRLDGQGVLRYDAAKTPGDYRREVRSAPDLATRFDRFLRLFEPIAFGNRPTDRSTFDTMSGLAREVVGE